MLPLDKLELQRIIRTAIAEDIGMGDITSELTIPENATAQMQFIAGEKLVACGTFIPNLVMMELGKAGARVNLADGKTAKKGALLATATGNARTLLAGERVALNLMQRMSGVATLTYKYVEAVKGTKAKILDTRKTMPGLRALDKYAVNVGGGENHRMRLDDMVLIKDNHLVIRKNIASAIKKARKKYGHLPVIVECDTIEQVHEAFAAKPDRILLDNMNIAQLKEAVLLAGRKIPLEASGGVSLETVRKIAETGVQYISVGRLTHSAPAADIRADINIRS
jgi:nicotinate-nucleotide pyrophosphorylase (carboxylating)